MKKINSFLLTDIGNTRIKVGYYDLQKKDFFYLSSFEVAEKPEMIAQSINKIIVDKKLDIINNIYSNVLHPKGEKILELISKDNLIKNIDAKKLFLKGENLKIVDKFESPNKIGTDILLGVLGIRYLFPKLKTFSILDFGTATTLVVYKNKQIQGVNIMLGISSTLNSLFEKTSISNDLAISKNNYFLGLNTVSAIYNGTIKGYFQMINSQIKDVNKNFKKINFFFTGGGYFKYKNDFDYFKNINYIEHLTFYGLIFLIKNNLTVDN